MYSRLEEIWILANFRIVYLKSIGLDINIGSFLWITQNRCKSVTRAPIKAVAILIHSIPEQHELETLWA